MMEWVWKSGRKATLRLKRIGLLFPWRVLIEPVRDHSFERIPSYLVNSLRGRKALAVQRADLRESRHRRASASGSSRVFIATCGTA